jgi:tryptophan-rich sensory protein
MLNGWLLFLCILGVLVVVSYVLSARRGKYEPGVLQPWIFQVVWPILFTLQSFALVRLLSLPDDALRRISLTSVVCGILLSWLWLAIPECKENPTVSILVLILATISFFIPTILMSSRSIYVTLCLIPTVVWLGLTPTLVVVGGQRINRKERENRKG